MYLGRLIRGVQARGRGLSKGSDDRVIGFVFAWWVVFVSFVRVLFVFWVWVWGSGRLSITRSLILVLGGHKIVDLGSGVPSWYDPPLKIVDLGPEVTPPPMITGPPPPRWGGPVGSRGGRA